MNVFTIRMRIWAVCVVAYVALLSGCASYRPTYSKVAVSSSRPALPIDGIWENNAGVRIRVCEGNGVLERGLPADQGSVLIRDLHQDAPGLYAGTAIVFSQARKVTAEGVATVTIPYRNCITIKVTHSESFPVVSDTVGEFFCNRSRGLDPKGSCAIGVLRRQPGVPTVWEPGELAQGG